MLSLAAHPQTPPQSTSHDFVDLYFWGCVEGHQLRNTYKQLSSSLRSSSAPAGRDLLQAEVDCYAHVQICARCIPLAILACKEGYSLMEQRDAERDHARPEITLFASSGRHTTTTTRLASDSPAHTNFLRHKRTCPTCMARPPLGRYTFQAWTPDGATAARALRLD